MCLDNLVSFRMILKFPVDLKMCPDNLKERVDDLECFCAISKMCVDNLKRVWIV